MKLLDGWATVSDTAKETGYNPVYLRWALRHGKIRGTKIGQMWLVDFANARERRTRRHRRREATNGE